jgi:DNA repair exonuclease SbcCD ATPase subunit
MQLLTIPHCRNKQMSYREIITERQEHSNAITETNLKVVHNNEVWSVWTIAWQIVLTNNIYPQKRLTDMKLTEFVDQVQKVEEDIVNKAEEIKNLIDQHKQQLIDELQATRSDQERHAGNVHRSIEERMTKMTEMRKYLNEQRTTSTLGDIGREMEALHSSTAELTNLDVIQTAVTDLASYNVIFRASEAKDNFVGKVVVRVPTTAGLLIYEIVEFFFSTPGPICN